MFYRDIIGCDEVAIGGLVDDFVGAVKSVVKSPVTKAVAGGVAIAFPAVGVPAVAALQTADMAITAAEAGSAAQKQSAKEVIQTTIRAANAGDRDARRAQRIIALDKLADTPAARRYLKSVVGNKRAYDALGAGGSLGATIYRAAVKKIQSYNAAQRKKAKAAGVRLPAVKRARLPTIAGSATNISDLALQRIDDIGTSVRYPTAAKFLIKASGNKSVRKLLSAVNLSSAGKRMLASLRSAVNRYNTAGKRKGERPVAWTPRAGSGPVRTLRKKAYGPPTLRRKVKRAVGKSLPPGKLIKKGPVAVGQRTAGIIITPTAIQHGQWARTA